MTWQPTSGSTPTARWQGTRWRRPERRNPLGKLPGSVWEIPSQPLTVPAHLGMDHFAAFPMELPRRCILGWSPPGCAPRAAKDGGRSLQTQRRQGSQASADRASNGNIRQAGSGTAPSGINARHIAAVSATITGYACGCPDATAPARPAIVVDPFGGTGTTALVASVLGRTGFSFDMSADYCRLARWRTSDPGERPSARRPETAAGPGRSGGPVWLTRPTGRSP